MEEFKGIDNWWLVTLGLLASGGVLTELVRRVFPSMADRKTAEENFRDDLMGRIGALNERTDRLSKELDEWRERFYCVREEKALLEAKYDVLCRANEMLENKYVQLKKEFDSFQERYCGGDT